MGTKHYLKEKQVFIMAWVKKKRGTDFLIQIN